LDGAAAVEAAGECNRARTNHLQGGAHMLVLSRKIGERIVISDEIVIEVLQIKGNQVRLGVTAPSGVRILREELVGSAPKANGWSAEPSLVVERR
jgi:carbon storage regulator